MDGDFNSLEKQYQAYNDFLKQRTSSGAFKATLFLDGIGQAKREWGPQQFEEDIARTKRWVDAHKGSPLAYKLHADALYAYGGYFRGGGFVDSVPAPAWKIYEEAVRKSAAFLIESEPVAGKDTVWHASMLNEARLAGWSEQVARRLFEEGLKKDSRDYRLYKNMLEYLLPKWLGNTQAVDAFINYAVEAAPPELGLELYARLYSSAGESQYKRRLYSDSLVNWSKMKDGLALWNKRFPTSWNKNIQAYHACIAGDKDLAKVLLDEINNQPVWDIWEPSARNTFDTCVRWASDPTAEPTEPRGAPVGKTDSVT